MNIYERVKSELYGSGARVFSIGSSSLGLPLLCAHRGGYGGTQIIVTAAIHARECYTALVVLEQIRAFGNAEHIRDCDEESGAYFIPLVNPDGALFFESGLDGHTVSQTYRRLIERSKVLRTFGDKAAMWKANADGVDLNCNFDANWGGGKSNRISVGASDFIGNYPLCAPESRALALFTRRVRPSATVSYHCMGGELYWQFFQSGSALRRDREIASAIANAICVKKVDGHLFSAGGYKDWCVSALGIPAVTVELISSGTHPFLPEAYARDITLNARLPEFILDLLNRTEL